ncbi:MAG: HyaD/HybD family hydrogenase maturation endopeptidase [Gemmatimonadales bacterium]|nr:HyaD/HybD family hydrogenase maturation endopeptidase [Gemmatimonadales bacterium]
MADAPIRVFGVGNPLLEDDGVGLALLQRLERDWELPGVELIDGGTWGMNLLPDIEEAEAVLFLDAADAGAPPGTVFRVAREEFRLRLGHKLSPHQVDLLEVLAMCELRGRLPARVAAIGVQPRSLDMTLELSPPVAAAVPRALEEALAVLREWGVVPRRRAEPVAAAV